MKNNFETYGIRFPIRDRVYTIERISVEEKQLTIDWQDGHTSCYNRFWLRDNCSSAGDKLTAIRDFHLCDMNDHTLIKTAELTAEELIEITWQHESHISTYHPAWLREHCYESISRRQRKHQVKLWDAEINADIPTNDYLQLEVGNAENLQLLKNIVDYGVARVVNLPKSAEGIEPMEALLAPFTENDFGKIFDLISEPKVWDLSQSSSALNPHSDDPYRYAPPGVRILFCVQASDGDSGQSEMVNGLAACEQMRHEDPDGFKLLVETSIPYVRYREDRVPQGGDVHLRAHAPVIRLDADGAVSGIRFHERSMATFDLPSSIVDQYYQALIRLANIITSGDYSLKHLLQPGEAFVFDNQQVLHGRTGFTGTTSRRHLRLCQMDRDLVHSRYRLLLSQHGEYGAADTLANGVS